MTYLGMYLWYEIWVELRVFFFSFASALAIPTVYSRLQSSKKKKVIVRTFALFLVMSAAMAAAIAAAAEIAKHTNIYLYEEMNTTKIVERQQQLQIAMPTDNSQEDNSENFPQENGMGHAGACAPEELEEDAESRLARSRERNREHARKTRLRKKAQLEGLQSKVESLQAESRKLKQSIEDCSIASILVGLSNETSEERKSVETLLDNLESNSSSRPQAKVPLVAGGKRKRFITEESLDMSPEPLKLNIDGNITLIGAGKSQINWKSGVYSDDNGAQHQLTQKQLESLRRERNRMHAKMTRDRKKGYIAAVEKTIEQLESENRDMREALSNVVQRVFGTKKPVTPVQSPLFAALNPDGLPPSLTPNDDPTQIRKVSVTPSCDTDEGDGPEKFNLDG